MQLTAQEVVLWHALHAQFLDSSFSDCRCEINRETDRHRWLQIWHHQNELLKRNFKREVNNQSILHEDKDDELECRRFFILKKPLKCGELQDRCLHIECIFLTVKTTWGEQKENKHASLINGKK